MLPLLALLTTLQTAPATRPTPDNTARILTPATPPIPAIHGPRLFAVRPNHPLLYTIPATGDRPLTFSAENLPPTVTLDPASGQLRGALPAKGETQITLHATNALGTASKPFTLVCGDTIALTPPMGWNSYNVWSDHIDEDKIRRAATAMVASGLINHGWTYINIDDGWQGKRGGPFNALQPDDRHFTDLKKVCDDVHALGLKPGIYNTPWVKAYSGRLGGSAENPEGTEQHWDSTVKNKKILPHAIGKFNFATNDAKQYAAWGIDYLKLDWGPVEPPETKIVADSLIASGRDIVLSVSNNHVQNVKNVIDDLAPLVNAWRTTTDITDNWKRVATDIGATQTQWSKWLSPGHYPDPDMLVVGTVGWGEKKQHYTKLTPDEQYTHITLWCMLSAPLLLGCDLEKLDPFTLSLLTNDEVLAINQDAAVNPPVRHDLGNGLEAYTKPLEDGTTALALFNRGDADSSVTLKLTDLHLPAPAPAQVRDLWRQKDLGPLLEVTTTLGRHGAAMYKLTPATP